MSAHTSLITLGLLGLTTPLLAQFSPPVHPVVSSGPEVDAYVGMIADGEWDTRLGWTTVDSSFQMDFDPFSIMTVGLVGLGTDANKHLGIQWGEPEDYDPSNPTTAANSHTLFHRPDTMAPGHFIQIDLDGHDSFDFWLSLEPEGRLGSHSIWSLFNPDLNVGTPVDGRRPDQFQGSVQTVAADGDSYYLFSFRDASNRTATEALRFFVHFSDPQGTPFTPVPEPSTYGIIGALLLGGLIGVRRWKAKAATRT